MTLIEYVKLKQGYRIVLPVKIRQQFHVKEGELLKMIYDEEGVIIIKKFTLQGDKSVY